MRKIYYIVKTKNIAFNKGKYGICAPLMRYKKTASDLIKQFKDENKDHSISYHIDWQWDDKEGKQELTKANRWLE